MFNPQQDIARLYGIQAAKLAASNARPSAALGSAVALWGEVALLGMP